MKPRYEKLKKTTQTDEHYADSEYKNKKVKNTDIIQVSFHLQEL